MSLNCTSPDLEAFEFTRTLELYCYECKTYQFVRICDCFLSVHFFKILFKLDFLIQFTETRFSLFINTPKNCISVFDLKNNKYIVHYF